MKIPTIPCFFYKITGFYCPGCGITRMILSIAKGDYYQAFRYNPFLFLSLPLFLFLFVNHFLHYRFLTRKKQNNIYIAFIIFLVLYGILRNIPFFSYLKPTKVS
ncbi:MAG: DUF2752 domain-containing protein [Bacilli bacterium]|nr:DUF2752 domain-containing protein [Bacilli bacterium]